MNCVTQSFHAKDTVEKESFKYIGDFIIVLKSNPVYKTFELILRHFHNTCNAPNLAFEPQQSSEKRLEQTETTMLGIFSVYVLIKILIFLSILTKNGQEDSYLSISISMFCFNDSS